MKIFILGSGKSWHMVIETFTKFHIKVRIGNYGGIL